MDYYQFNEALVTSEQQAFVKDLLICKNFEHSDRLLGASRGRGVTWFLRTPELGVDCVLRHYFRGGLFGKCVKDRYFFSGLARTRAMQEFRLLAQMRQWHLPVPRPVAVCVQRQFCCYRADILLEKLPNTQDLSQYLQNNMLSATEYQQIGALVRQLHDHQVHHSDLNIHNILRDEKQFWLIDFDKCRIQAGEKWKAQNLARLERSFWKEKGRLGIAFDANAWQALLMGYHAK